MNDLSWQSGSIIAIGILFVLPALFIFANDGINAYRRRQRRNKRLYGHGNVYSQRDFK